MDFRLIKAPAEGAINMIQRRLDPHAKIDVASYEAIGLLQGKLCDMTVAADIAEKSAGVVAADVRGSCPQNLVMLAIFGDTASVETALRRIKNIIDEQTSFRFL